MSEYPGKTCIAVVFSKIKHRMLIVSTRLKVDKIIIGNCSKLNDGEETESE